MIDHQELLMINLKFKGIDSNRIDIAIYYENNTDSKKLN